MKVVAPVLVGLWIFGTSAQAAPMTKGERQRLVAHLQMTAAWLDDEVAHLSPAQLQYHPGPGRWSVADVVEHLHLAEPIYWRQFHDALKAPPSDKRPPVSDLDVLWYGIDRTQKQQTSPDKVPQAKPDFQAALSAFRKLHAEFLEYARTTDDDLRGRLIEGEGTDAYQWVLMLSTHAQRHILQIVEIKADPGFPKQ